MATDNFNVQNQQFRVSSGLFNETTDADHTRHIVQRCNYSFVANKNNVPTAAYILRKIRYCTYCQAVLFEKESNNFCCSQGQISLVANRAPESLIQLFTSQSEEVVNFKCLVRTYNNIFTFTSFGVKYDEELCHGNKGLYTFRVQGQVYHYINELLPFDRPPSFLQLYFYDTEHEVENRMHHNDRLNPVTIKIIIAALKENPYCVFFHSLSNITELEKHTIIIRNDVGLDQRVYNTPSASQIAAIWTDGDDNGFVNNHHILVSSRPGVTHKVQYFFGCDDPLKYPLLFPYGKTGWHYGIQHNLNSNNSVRNRDASLLAPDLMISVDDLLD